MNRPTFPVMGLKKKEEEEKKTLSEAFTIIGEMLHIYFECLKIFAQI